METILDLFIIGGGINGVAIAADAAGRGLAVTLCEKNELASGTSSASTKLIHGGLRYLELGEFKLVKESLEERSILIKRAPHLITPLEFIMPYEKKMRPIWLIRLGLFLYDHLSRKNLLPRSRFLNLKNDIRGTVLRDSFTKGFSYYDAFTDDKKLVFLNALSAEKKGASLLIHTEFLSAERENGHWKIKLHDHRTQETYYVYAKALLNACGPWVANTNELILNTQPIKVKLVKGSHIILPKLYEGHFAYLLQHVDKRVIFVIPYQEKFSLIGTTDVPWNHQTDPSQEEKQYLCDTVNHYFKHSIKPEDIVGSFSGVRCLQDENQKKLSEITRDYQLLLDDNTPPLLTVIGGKLTTHRRLAEEALEKLRCFFPKMGPAWTSH